VLLIDFLIWEAFYQFLAPQSHGMICLVRASFVFSSHTHNKEQIISMVEDQEVSQHPDGEEPEQELSFMDVVGLFVNQAAIALGAAPHPLTGSLRISFEEAQYHISILDVLKEKTKGNLTDEEDSVLARLIDELKLAFVHAIRDPKVREMAEMSAQNDQQQASRIVTPDGRPASAGDNGPRIIIP